MSDLSRREAVKLAAGLAVGGGALAVGIVHGETAKETSDPQPVADPELEDAIQNPQSFMFREQVTFRLKGDGHSRALYITSARDPRERQDRNNTQVRVPSGAMRIFRADTNQDEFTRQGGIYWRFHEQKGRIQFNQPGALVMIVRDRDDTVRCYSLVHDLRC